jgi:HEAT repeat protein
VKALEPARADWVPVALPLTFGSGFDPSVPVPDDDPSAKVRAKTAELFKKINALQDTRLKENGKTMLLAHAPNELNDDVSEDQLKVLASLIHALGQLKVEGARERLKPWLKESSPSIRAAASAALADVGGEALALAAPGLFDSERQVQSATAQAMGQAGAPGQALLLEAIRQLTGDRSRLLEGLRTQSLAPSAVPILLDVVNEGGADAATAASLLGNLQSATAVAPLLAMLDDPTTVARRDVLLALGRLKDPKAADGVGHDLYSDSAPVRAAAAEALATLGLGSNGEALDALKGDYAVQVRVAAQNTLSHLSPGDKR